MRLERRATPDKEESGVASEAEAREAIEGLSKADYAKLMLIARGFARARLRGSAVEAEDLLQEAIVKTLDGRRTWNRRVSILKHLDRVMESDAGHIAERRDTHYSVPMAKGPDVPATRADDPNVRVVARQDLDNLLELFAGEKEALEVLNLKGEGFSASEIRQVLGISSTQYDTVTKRVRRRLAKHLSEGDLQS